MRKCAVIRDAMRRARPVLGDQVALLATAGGADLAVGTGLLLGAAARRTPVVLDGVVSAAAALVAQRIAFRAVDWWLAGHRTGDPAHDWPSTGSPSSRCSTWASTSAKVSAR